MIEFAFELFVIPCAHTTKQLEKDFGDAAFATVRSFVLKFTDLGLLNAQKMKNKVLYSVS